MAVLLLGDSHLARVTRDLPLVAEEVRNVAVGGTVATGLADQLRGLDPASFDAVVLSVGTNDAASWREQQATRSLAALGEVLGAHRARWVYVVPPGIDVAGLGPVGAGMAEAVARFGASAAALVGRVGGTAVDSPRLLAPLGERAFADDGVHLSGAAYAVLLPAIGDAVSGLVASG